MKGAKRYMEIILMLFVKKISFRAKGHFGLKMAGRHNSGSTLRIFSKFGLMKGAKRYVHENYINGFSEKNIILAIGSFRSQK